MLRICSILIKIFSKSQIYKFTNIKNPLKFRWWIFSYIKIYVCWCRNHCGCSVFCTFKFCMFDMAISMETVRCCACRRVGVSGEETTYIIIPPFPFSLLQWTRCMQRIWRQPRRWLSGPPPTHHHRSPENSEKLPYIGGPAPIYIYTHMKLHA